MTASPKTPRMPVLWGLLWIISATGVAHADRVVLVAGGDVAYPTGWFQKQARARGDALFAGIKPLLLGADLRFLNLESPITTRPPTAEKTYPLVTRPDFLGFMVQAGFNLFSLANNHTGDAGPDGLKDTFAALSALSTRDRPLYWAGAGLTRGDRKRPRFFTINHTRVAFLAFRLSGAALANPMAKHAAEDQIRAASAHADLVIVSAHGGAEYQAVPGAWKARRWRAFVDAGADVVLGHGPHNPQGLERYRGAAIYYSLGNLSFGTRPRKQRTGGMLLRAFLARVTFDAGRVVKAEAIPLFVDNRVPWRVEGVTLPVRLFTPTVVGPPHRAVMLNEARQWSAAIQDNATRLTPCGAAWCF